jgi:hypothetical protein
MRWAGASTRGTVFHRPNAHFSRSVKYDPPVLFRARQVQGAANHLEGGWSTVSPDSSRATALKASSWPTSASALAGRISTVATTGFGLGWSEGKARREKRGRQSQGEESAHGCSFATRGPRYTIPL